LLLKENRASTAGGYCIWGIGKILGKSRGVLLEQGKKQWGLRDWIPETKSYPKVYSKVIVVVLNSISSLVRWPQSENHYMLA
jgi:hypothetical protein